MRVFELAKELGISSKKLMNELETNGVSVSNHMQALDPDTIEIMKEIFLPGKKVSESKAPVREAVPAAPKAPPGTDAVPVKEKSRNRSEVVGKEILLDGIITVQEFADLIGVPGTKLLGELIKMGRMLPLTAQLDSGVAESLAERLGYKLVAVEEEPEEEPVDSSRLQSRSPVVTVMGHVDHGKTTLLDAIRRTHVAEREAGGITQHIGASWVDLEDGRIVFLDTPGHAAFTKLRARGAQITDVVILIVAADDGVMPQTIEAINHAKEAGVPIIVAVNKCDMATADIEKTKQDLVTQNLVPEEWGGDTQVVMISAKKNEGVRQLLETVLFQADLMDLKAEFDCPARGVVIEARLDKGKGPVATVLVKDGSLHVGDVVITGEHWGRIRAMIDWQGRNLQSAKPSTPVEILGLSGVPRAGDMFKVTESEKSAKEEAHRIHQQQQEKSLVKKTKITFDDLFSQIQTGSVKELKVVLKTDVQGSLEAVQESLEKLGAGQVKIDIIHAGIGAISDNDVMLASASNAVVIGFNVRPSGGTIKLAEREKVEIRIYRVIYDLINEIKAALEGMLEPETEEVVVGQAEIRQTFNVPKVGTIAGCSVISGKILRTGGIRVVRDGAIVWEGKIGALRRFKDDVREVAHGFECGISLDGFNDIKIGDVLESFEIREK